MAKRSEHNNSKRQARQPIADPIADLHHKPQRVAAVEPLTETQRKYRSAILANDVTFGVGPAGTGKTYMPAALAAQAFIDKRISKIILTRPAVEAGEEFGFIPGTLEEKFEPYLAPFRHIFSERMGTGPYEYALKAKRIEPVPIAFMRGLTFNDAWVIVDEAQNVTPKQMKLILTRLGQNCKLIVCGDTDQRDICGPSGLTDAIKRMSWINSVSVVKFTRADVVRSGLVRDVLLAYAEEEEEFPG